MKKKSETKWKLNTSHMDAEEIVQKFLSIESEAKWFQLRLSHSQRSAAEISTFLCTMNTFNSYRSDVFDGWANSFGSLNFFLFLCISINCISHLSMKRFIWWFGVRRKWFQQCNGITKTKIYNKQNSNGQIKVGYISLEWDTQRYPLLWWWHSCATLQFIYAITAFWILLICL